MSIFPLWLFIVIELFGKSTNFNNCSPETTFPSESKPIFILYPAPYSAAVTTASSIISLTVSLAIWSDCWEINWIKALAKISPISPFAKARASWAEWKVEIISFISFTLSSPISTNYLTNKKTRSAFVIWYFI